MGTIPPVPTVTAGTSGAAADFNNLGKCVTFWALTPRCYAYQATLQSLTHNVSAVISLDAEVYDVPNNYDGGSDVQAHDSTGGAFSNSRVYARTSGKYEVTGQLQCASNATGVRVAQARLNAAGAVGSGTQISLNQQAAVSGASTSVTLPTVEVALVAGDYLELFGLQTSGGALNTVPGLGISFLRIKLTGS